MCTQSQLDLNKYLPVSETLAALSCIFNWNLSGLFLRAISPPLICVFCLSHWTQNGIITLTCPFKLCDDAINNHNNAWKCASSRGLQRFGSQETTPMMREADRSVKLSAEAPGNTACKVDTETGKRRSRLQNKWIIERCLLWWVCLMS